MKTCSGYETRRIIRFVLIAVIALTITLQSCADAAVTFYNNRRVRLLGLLIRNLDSQYRNVILERDVPTPFLDSSKQ